MRHIPLSLTSASAVEDAVSFVGEKVGHPVSSSSSRGEVTIGEVVPNTKLGIEEVGLTVPVPTSDCVGGTVVTSDDFVMQSSLLT
jgi:hypothetical protein